MRKLGLVCILAFVATFIGCGLFGDKDYHPLTVGNIWKYDITTITVQTTRTDTTHTTTTTTITGTDKLSDEKEVFVVTTTVGSTTTTSYELEENDFILGYSSKTDTMPDTLLALPLEDGKTWVVTTYAPSGEITAKVTGKGDATVEAGEYKDCWILEYSYPSAANYVSNKTWVADGVGGVKTYVEQKIPTPTGDIVYKITTELSEVTVK